MILRNHPDSGVLIVDVAVPNSAYPRMITLARKEGGQSGLPNYTFGHAGDGNIHLNLIGRKGDAQQWRRIEAIAAKMVEHALALGGTATGEHGVGIGKRRFMPKEHGDSLAWMRKIKGLFDPNHILNPGKIFIWEVRG
jgi:D-lactate dehydrogenase (cytochrome)